MTQFSLLLKQVLSSLSDLKNTIEKFESDPSPDTQYAEQLYLALQKSNKLTSAYMVLREQKDISTDFNLHMKLMAVPSGIEQHTPEVGPEKPPVQLQESMQAEATPITTHVHHTEEELFPKKGAHTRPSLSININDKFRFINELFKGNTAEYNIAIEQLNAIGTLEDATTYLKGLKTIYTWDDNHEMVKKLVTLIQKRLT